MDTWTTSPLRGLNLAGDTWADGSRIVTVTNGGVYNSTGEKMHALTSMQDGWLVVGQPPLSALLRMVWQRLRRQ